jgi:hypothetical protein
MLISHKAWKVGFVAEVAYHNVYITLTSVKRHIELNCIVSKISNGIQIKTKYKEVNSYPLGLIPGVPMLLIVSKWVYAKANKIHGWISGILDILLKMPGLENNLFKS